MTSFYDKPPPLVLFLVFPGVKLLDIAGPLQVFTDADDVSSYKYDTAVVSLQGGSINTDTVLSIPTEPIEHWFDRKIDTLIIAGGTGVYIASQDACLVEEVQKIAKNCKRIGSVCTGAFLLAASGLLDDRRAVTHWDACEQLAREYPEINVEYDPIYIKDEHIWTSAGVTAGIDLSLAMITEDFGRTTGLAIARSLVTYMARPGGQSQFSTILESQIKDASGRFDNLHDWIATNLHGDLRVERLAEYTNMSTRNFSRAYTSNFNQSPAKAVEKIRLEAARHLLEETNIPISTVATRCGFGDDERMRRAFQRSLFVSPSDYRQRFRSTTDDS